LSGGMRDPARPLRRPGSTPPSRMLVYGCAVLFTLFMLTPLYLVVLAAFSPRAAIFDYPRPLFPTAISLDSMTFFLTSHGVLPAFGRSLLVGRPLAFLLLERNATVTVCHSRTRDLPAVCARADVLVGAAGSPRLLGADAVRPGAAVIDVGINRLDDGLVGDVDFEAASERAGLITPVPGGVGPMTIACLLRNTLQAARAARGATPVR